MKFTLLPKLLVTALLLGYLVSSFTLWLCRSTLHGLCNGALRARLPQRSGQ